MFKKIISLILIGLIFSLVCHTKVMANPENNKFVLKVQTAVTKLGIGFNARIKVKLRDKTKVEGYISKINEDSFTVISGKTNTAVRIPYPQVKQVRGKNNLTGEEILIGVGIAIVTVLLVIAISRSIN